jgi:hypothetical protein
VKAKKYGFGGKKAVTKNNTSESSSDFSSYSAKKNKSVDPEFRVKKKNYFIFLKFKKIFHNSGKLLGGNQEGSQEENL